MVMHATGDDGQVYEFPDDASLDDVNSTMAGFNSEFANQKTMASGAKNIGAGVLSGIKGLAQIAQPIAAAGSAVASGGLPLTPFTNSGVNNFDPYKTMGTTQQPISTLPGQEQFLGGMMMPAGPTGDAASIGVGEAVHEAGGVGKLASDLGSKVTNMFSPGKQATALVDNLGNGAANTQESGTSIASAIRDGYNKNNSVVQPLYDSVSQAVGSKPIYQSVDPLISTAMDKSQDMIDQVKDLNVGDAYDAFSDNPSFDNAHRLQSKLGLLINDTASAPRTGETRLQIQNLSNVRTKLQGDISSFLQGSDADNGTNLAPTYQQASDLYKTQVAPYLSSSKLRDIVDRGKTIVPNVHGIFQNPYDLQSKMTGNVTTGPANKILADLPQDTKDQILFNKIGGNVNSDDPDALVKSINNADQKGFSHLVSPQTRAAIDNINSASRAKSLLKTGAVLGAGAIGIGSLGPGIGLGYGMYKHLMNSGQ